MDERESQRIEASTDELLEELQQAAEMHQAILERQAELISRLREELKGVRGGPS